MRQCWKMNHSSRSASAPPGDTSNAGNEDDEKAMIQEETNKDEDIEMNEMAQADTFDFTELLKHELATYKQTDVDEVYRQIHNATHSRNEAARHKRNNNKQRRKKKTTTTTTFDDFDVQNQDDYSLDSNLDYDDNTNSLGTTVKQRLDFERSNANYFGQQQFDDDDDDDDDKSDDEDSPGKKRKKTKPTPKRKKNQPKRRKHRDRSSSSSSRYNDDDEQSEDDNDEDYQYDDGMLPPQLKGLSRHQFMRPIFKNETILSRPSIGDKTENDFDKTIQASNKGLPPTKRYISTA